MQTLEISCPNLRCDTAISLQVKKKGKQNRRKSPTWLDKQTGNKKSKSHRNEIYNNAQKAKKYKVAILAFFLSSYPLSVIRRVIDGPL